MRRILVDVTVPTRARIETLWAISQVPVDNFNYHLGSTKDSKAAPLGGRFDEMIVAAAPLVGYGQFPCADPNSQELYEFRRLIRPTTLKHVPVHLLCQFRMWDTLHAEGRGRQELGDASFKSETDELFSESDRNDPFQFSALVSAEARSAGEDGLVGSMRKNVWLSDHVSFETTDDYRLRAVLATRRVSVERSNFAVLRLGLTDDSQEVRRAAVQWVGEDNLQEYRWLVEALLADPTTTPDLFLACLATLQFLDGKPASEFEQHPPTEYIAAMVTDASRPATLRTTALRMLPSNAPELTAPLLTELVSSDDANLRLEAVRTLASSPLPEARELLLKVAANPQASVEMRAEAMAGLGRGEALPADVEALLLKIARGDVDLSDASQKRNAVETLQLEALRSLRGRAGEGSRIRAEVEKAGELASENSALKDAIEIVLTGKSSSDPRHATGDPQLSGDPLSGRRVFFHHNGPLCAKCHMVQGRGGQVGPDLTVIARTADREKLLNSILEPSKEIAPQFTPWIIQTTNGKTHTGFILEDNRTGQIKLGTPEGDAIVIHEDEIETREPSKTSVMPEKLRERMTTQELRDLLAFLLTLK